MSTTIQQAFLKLRQNLEITGLQAEVVSTRQKTVREVVEAGIEIYESFLTGSYSRSTMIAPLSEADIDIFFVLNVRYYQQYNGQNGGQAGLLDFVKKTLRRTYTKTPDISRNGQAVTIRFDDFMVDVVPGFNRNGGGFLIPNSISQSWIETDPKKHVELISAANKTHEGNFIPLIKMIKGWNRKNGKHFSSFHLEVLALQILNGVKISDFPSGVRYFFDKGRSFVAMHTPDPAGYKGNIGSYINTQEKRQEALVKFDVAYSRSIKAEDYASRGYVRESMEMWSKVFGNYFPAYG